MTARTCTVEGCGRKHFSKGFCNVHLKRWMRHGDPLLGGTEQGAPLAWLREAAASVGRVDCLIWPYAQAAGYGSINIGGKRHGVHRLVCEMAVVWRHRLRRPSHHPVHRLEAHWLHQLVVGVGALPNLDFSDPRDWHPRLHLPALPPEIAPSSPPPHSQDRRAT